MVLVAVLTWLGAHFHHTQAQARHMQSVQGQLLKVQSVLDDLHVQRDVLEGQLAVERSTREGLEATLNRIQKELGAAQDQIAFFHELMPPGPEGSISVRGLDIQKKGDLLHYRVVLMRHGAATDDFEGSLQFEATGVTSDGPATVILEPARASGTNTVSDGTAVTMGTDSQDEDVADPVLALHFEQFQRSSGLLQIPAGLVPEEVTLNVLEGQTLRASRSVNLPWEPHAH